MQDNKNLKKLYDADVRDRKQKNPDWTRVSLADKQLQKSISLLLQKKLVRTPADYYHAAYIFQHSVDTAGIERAKRLAHQAMKMGEERARWLYAAATDRLLMHRNRRQKFGTQYIQFISPGKGERVTRRWRLWPYDVKTSDTQRRRFNVPNLRTLKRGPER
jgi:hypothetical protein